MSEEAGSGGEENRDVEIAEMRDTLQTMMTTIQDLKQRLDALTPHAPNRPASAPASAPRPSAGQSQAQLAQPQPAAPQSSESKAWLAKDIVQGKYDYHQSPQQALITLKSFLDDLNAASPVITALSTLDLSNTQQVSNWAQTNRDTLYTITENFTERANDALKSLARLAGYVDYLKDKAFGGSQGQGGGQGRQGSSSSSSSFSRPSRYRENG
jgi:hypothetical protein